MWTSRLLILLLFAMLCGEAGRTWASAKDRSDHQEEGRSDISAFYEIHDDTTTITIDWEGCRENGMLVVSLDSRVARSVRSSLVNWLARELFGLVLARSAGVTGSATFSYKRSEFADYLRDGELVLSVYLTNRIDLVYEPKGVIRLTAADCSDDFQILCKDSDSGIGKIFFGLHVFPGQGTPGGRCGVELPDEEVRGFIYLDIAQ